MPAIAVKVPNETLMPLVAEAIASGRSATILARGYSMRPFVESGRDKLVVSPFTALHVGDAVLADVGGRYVLHRIIDIDGERLTLQGDGNVVGTESCRVADVLGVVTRYVYPHREVSASDPALCRRIRLWRRLRPVRRYLLWIYRKTHSFKQYED